MTWPPRDRHPPHPDAWAGEHNATGNEYAVKFIKKEGKDVDKDFDATAVMEKNIGALSGT